MKIHALSATELLAHLSAGEVSSVEIVRALIARIEAVEPAIGAITQRRFEEALTEAGAADAERAAGRGGPLCGLPITLKENFDLAGTEATMGVKARRGRVSSQDAVLVRALRRAGAVIIAKTNVPQLLMAQETENAIWGVTKNPWNTARTPGGSSGGEAAAVAAGMTPLGMGSDIGGSIRIPCHFSGIAGLKPTVDRWSNRGMNGAVPGQELVRSQVGPMARKVADLALAWRSVDPMEMAREDPYVIPMAAGDPAGVQLEGMRVGWYEDDGYLTPTHSIRRALTAARGALVKAGATLVPYTPPDGGEVLFLWLAAISSDGARTYKRVLDGEPFIPQLAQLERVLRVPELGRKLLAAGLDRIGDRRAARYVREVGLKPVDTYWDLVAQRTVMRRAAFDAWNHADVDVVICPPHAAPAMQHRESGEFALALSYLFRYSLLNFPAGVVPVTRVTDADIATSKGGGDRVERMQAGIDAASHGLPVGVQVVGRPYQEDKVLAVMAAIEAEVSRMDGYPKTPVDPKGDSS